MQVTNHLRSKRKWPEMLGSWLDARLQKPTSQESACILPHHSVDIARPKGVKAMHEDLGGARGLRSRHIHDARAWGWESDE